MQGRGRACFVFATRPAIAVTGLLDFRAFVCVVYVYVSRYVWYDTYLCSLENKGLVALASLTDDRNRG